MAIEHGLFLLDSQMQEIVDIVLEMHNENPEKCTEAIKEPSNNDQIKQTYKIEKNVNGWQRLIINFTVKETPRWWQFWKTRINSRDFEYSIWMKSNDELYLFKPHIEEK